MLKRRDGVFELSSGEIVVPIGQYLGQLRSVIEGFARGKKVKRRLPNGVEIYVSPDSQLKYLGKTFDLDLLRLAESHVTASSVVWDIGANCGVLSFSSAKAAQIVAVEADPFLCNLLQDSVSMNGVPVIILSAAASSHGGLAEFAIAKRGRASNHLASVNGRSQAGGERGRFLVPTVALDTLLESLMPPTLVKIDVEGAEVEVLSGAMRVLKEHRPVIYLETGTGTHTACERLLVDAGYIVAKAAEMNWLCTPK